MNTKISIGFDALFNSASMGIAIIDDQGYIILANPFLLRLFGYEQAELTGSPIERLIPSRFHEHHKVHLSHYILNQKTRRMGFGMDLFAINKEGTEFPVEVSLGSHQTSQGNFTIAYVSDISKRKEAEMALNKLNEGLESKIKERTASLTHTVKQLEHLITEIEAKDAELGRLNRFLNNVWDHADAIIFVTDKEGLIKMFNPSAERHLGYCSDEVINKVTPLKFYTEADIFKKAKLLSQQLNHDVRPDFSVLSLVADQDLRMRFEDTYIRKDGTSFPVSLTITPMRNADSKIDGYLAIVINDSERKKTENELKQALEREKGLGELKSRFVSMASHEFRTPLSTVLSSIYLISKYTQAEDQPKREKHVQRIVSSVNMLTGILNDFLSVGKIEEGRIQVRYSTFQIEQNMRDTINELGLQLKKCQTIHYKHEGNTTVTLDIVLLKHIVMNLISNAIKFSLEDCKIEVSSKKTDDGLTLSFKDYGIGISPEDQHHLFERFFRGENATNIQGTGLGLNIVGKYAELMNGTITFTSELGKGTTFTVTFVTNKQHQR